MPRRISSQVPQTVSRLLESGFLKQPPAWFEAVINHPPVTVPARHPVKRPDEDLPPRLRSSAQPAIAKVGSLSKAASKSQQIYGRDTTNSKKKSRALTPKLTPKAIVYDEDKIRQQFFRDHPWEAYRPKTLVEMSDEVGSEARVHGDPKRLRSYGRNPSVEDVVACTMAAHRQGGLSLSQAYHNTLSSYHGLKAEHEHATRYAALEAKYYGADFGKSETQRGFEKEDKALETWAAWAAGGMATGDAANAAADSQQTKAARVKRTDQTFTSGDAYLEAAKAFKEGKISSDRLASSAEAAINRRALLATGNGVNFAPEPADDFLGLARSTIRTSETPTSEAQ
ncbi:related to RSM25-mitochondrial ribosomal protein, small subunit [Ustilago bromivora]|uniref:Small ribosomal subunit protein mS23 n=1 Tax=Ustilago bromivora TaxID=307758 RepID=A0A1K0FZI6_9BASI|nr:related to RSM25-mitochondrial ribosomal protein, small subunit [Ustilago bromivora]SYW85191.1 related to RSM25 - mitochondrial ribosomal protein, small subunit [Ustilago bromivora]